MKTIAENLADCPFSLEIKKGIANLLTTCEDDNTYLFEDDSFVSFDECNGVVIGLHVGNQYTNTEMCNLLAHDATNKASIAELKEEYFQAIWYKFNDLTLSDLNKSFEELGLWKLPYKSMTSFIVRF